MKSCVAVLCALLVPACASTSSAPAFKITLPDARVEAAPSEAVLIDGAATSGASSSSAIAAPAAAAEDESRHLTLLVGTRVFSEGLAEDLDVDRPMIWGLEYNSYKVDSGTGWEAGFAMSDESSSVNGLNTGFQLIDIYAGIRHTFFAKEGQLHPYVSGGGAFIDGEVDSGLNEDSDSAWGLYVRAGIEWAFDNDWRIGVDYRHVFGELTIADEDFGVDYDQFAFTLGFPF